jgi:hypothetical protein
MYFLAWFYFCKEQLSFEYILKNLVKYVKTIFELNPHGSSPRILKV